jgi:hypothetical protein
LGNLDCLVQLIGGSGEDKRGHMNDAPNVRVKANPTQI